MPHAVEPNFIPWHNTRRETVDVSQFGHIFTIAFINTHFNPPQLVISVYPNREVYERNLERCRRLPNCQILEHSSQLCMD